MLFTLVQKGAGPIAEGSDVEDEEDIDFDDEDFEGNILTLLWAFKHGRIDV